MLLKGEASLPDTHSFALKTPMGHKHGVGIIKMKDAESLRVRTTQGLDVHLPGLSQTLQSRVTGSLSMFIPGPASVSQVHSHRMF